MILNSAILLESLPASHDGGKFTYMVSLMAADDVPGTDIPILDSQFLLLLCQQQQLMLHLCQLVLA